MPTPIPLPILNTPKSPSDLQNPQSKPEFAALDDDDPARPITDQDRQDHARRIAEIRQSAPSPSSHRRFPLIVISSAESEHEDILSRGIGFTLPTDEIDPAAPPAPDALDPQAPTHAQPFNQLPTAPFPSPRHLTLLAGPPGVGKSFLALDVAARLSRAGLGSLIFSAEDSTRALVARLLALKADLSKVHIFGAIYRRDDPEYTLSLPRDELAIYRAMLEVPNLALMVFDPLPSFLGTTLTSHSPTIRAIDSLDRLAEQNNAAIIGITHTRIYQRSADHPVIGSLAFTSRPRANYLLSRAPAPVPASSPSPSQISDFRSQLASPPSAPASPAPNPTTPGPLESPPPSPAPRTLPLCHPATLPLLLTCHKSNFPIHPAPILITLNQSGFTYGSRLPSHPASHPAPDPKPVADDPGPPTSSLLDAADFLTTELKSGPLPVNSLLKLAHQSGHSPGTIRRAKTYLGLHSTRSLIPPENRPAWYWSLPPNPFSSPAARIPVKQE